MTLHIQKTRMSAIGITLGSYGVTLVYLAATFLAGAALFFTAANVMGVV